MSHDDRDKAGGHALRHPRLLDCLCCEDLDRRESRQSRATRKRLEVQFDAAAEETTDDSADEPVYDEHVFVAGRCLRCHTNWIDAAVYDGLEVCPERTDDVPVTYSTSTNSEPVSSHPIP